MEDGEVRSDLWIALAYCLAARTYELTRSRRGERALLARGGRLVEDDAFAPLAAVHALWFVAMITEELVLGPTALPDSVRIGALVAFLVAESVRYVCIATLGERWNIRVIVVDGEERVRRGMYRVLPHPNYVAAAVGVIALPLAIGLPWTALAVAPPKLLVLRRRIRIENDALREAEVAAPSAPR